MYLRVGRDSREFCNTDEDRVRIYLRSFSKETGANWVEDMGRESYETYSQIYGLSGDPSQILIS